MLTRTIDVNLSGSDRAGMAFDHRAKLFLCVHFNGNNNPAIRGCETFFRAASNGNLNLAADQAFAAIVNDTVFSSLAAIDAGANNRGVKPDTDTGPGALGVLNDTRLGNGRRPGDMCSAAYLELEFITNPQVDRLLISGPEAMANRTAVMAALATAIRGYMRGTAELVAQPVAQPVGPPLDLLAGLGAAGPGGGRAPAGGGATG